MKQEKREERFAMLLDAAEECFREMGFKRTSLEDVAARAGVGKATLYHYVEGKAELFGEVATRFHNRMQEQRKVVIDQQTTAVGKLRALITTFVESQEAAVKLIAPKPHEVEEHVPLKFRYLRMFRQKEKELISSILEFGIREGVFRELDIPKTATLIELGIKGVVMDVCRAPVKADAEAYADLLIDVILHGIEKR